MLRSNEALDNCELSSLPRCGFICVTFIRVPHVPKPDAFPWGWPRTLHAWGVLFLCCFHLVILHITNRDKKVGMHVFLQGFIILLIFFFSVSETFSFKTKGTVCEFSNIKKKWRTTLETSRNKLNYL